MPVELVYEGKDGVVRVALDDEVVLGRAPDCTLVIPDGRVSRKHARVFREGDAWRVADLGSTNGTRLNDSDDIARPLAHGDEIWVGENAVRFVDSSQPVPRVGQGLKFVDEQNDAGGTIFRSAVDFSALASGSTPTADRLPRLVAVVHEASRAILESADLDRTFDRILELIFEHMPVQRGFVVLRDGEGELMTRSERHRVRSSEATRYSRKIARQVIEEKVGVITMDAGQDDRFVGAESVVIQGIRSAMAAPLWRGDSVLGLLYVDKLDQAGAFDAFDLDLLSALGNQIAVAIERDRLAQAALEKERLDRELAVAREIQMGTLPSTMPELTGYDVAGCSHPAEETGGDTFDLVPLDDRRLMLLLGDATGHGIGPALSVTQVRSMLRIAVRLGADLDGAFRAINDQLSVDLADNRFVTAFLGVLDSETNRVTYHAGGQGPLLHYRAATGDFDRRMASTMPMGFMEGTDPKPAPPLELAPGDVLALMTDGIFEYENTEGEMFGDERVCELIRQHAKDGSAVLLETLLRSVREFSGGAAQNDDMTIVLVRRTA